MKKTETAYELIGSSAAIREIRAEVDCAARSDAKVLISGEGGVGKEAIARLIHQRGPRHAGPFSAINCAGVPDALLESELFGQNRGGSADMHARGWLHEAHAGILFLHKVCALSPRVQALLLKFLETGAIQPIDVEGVKSKVDVRIIAATEKNLHEEMLAGRFREDLYYRLNMIHITVPPLRERKGDVRLLIDEFVHSFSQAHQVPQPRLPEETTQALANYSWPGNVRELKNVVERLVVCARSGTVQPADLPIKIRQSLSATQRGLLGQAV